ncbi:MAG TPA: DUF3160 domain-containing protein [Polyangiales bacterium]|nr:DUF3160 domain-containing protein [Polyangiales bacterium]
MTNLRKSLSVWCLVAVGLHGCGSDHPEPAAPECPPGMRCESESPTQPGSKVELTLLPSDQERLGALQADVDSVAEATSESLLRAREVRFASELGYDPKAAKNLDLIQKSGLALDEDALRKLGEQGFAISKTTRFLNMANGLKTIYAEDLPVYISLDVILDAVHTSYEAILKDLERSRLSLELKTMLVDARTRNADRAEKNAQVTKDLDFYLGVAQGLLEGAAAKPRAGADAAQLASFHDKAMAGQGIQRVELFGVARDIDFSQFKPRGHYADSIELERYFRAMIWLGRTDFRLIETLGDGSRVFHRRQFDAVLALRDAIQGSALDAYINIDAVVSAFVGDHDYMQLREIEALLQVIGGDPKALSDQELATRIIEGGYGAQRIASQVMFKDPNTTLITLPLDRSFALLGQRYIVDSRVFSDVVYDRVLPAKGKPFRFLPNPLDAAYAALDNPAALPLLRSELDEYGYAPNLERVRKVVDAHGDDYWQQNLYTLWLAALRAASPRVGEQDQPGMPSVTRTEPWARRMLNTQLGSWAQLRHDTILYAKQSYSGSPSCEYPDAYVDPYPDAFARIADYAARGKTLGGVLGRLGSAMQVEYITKYFGELESVANILRDLAEQQQKGVPFNAAQMAFINDAVKSKGFGCSPTGPFSYEGWYKRLMYSSSDEEMKPTIADVHTDPGGDDRPPQVLHAATGFPRLLVVTVDTCDGPRAYAGVAYSYFEVVKKDLNRLNDGEWAGMARDYPDVPWVDTLLH